MERIEHSIEIGEETFRLRYTSKTSGNLIETYRPGQSIVQLLDSGRVTDMVLLLVAGLDETHEKDRVGKLTTTAVQKMQDRMMELLDVELERGVEWKRLFVPMKRAIGHSGLAGLLFDIDENGNVRPLEGKASTVTAAS